MATTTNYGWTTPDDTALVKDGAAAIRTLGSSVDTTTKNLNPETTLGDIAYRSSSANVKTRLGIGSTGNVLTVAGGVPTWAAPAGGAPAIAQIATGNLNSGTNLILSSLSSYDTLILRLNGITWGTASVPLCIAINGDIGNHLFASGSIVTGGAVNTSRDTTFIRFSTTTAMLNTSTANTSYIVFTNCKATGFTNYQWSCAFKDSTDAVAFAEGTGIYPVAAAVSSFDVFNSNLYTFNGTGTYTLYGG